MKKKRNENIKDVNSNNEDNIIESLKYGWCILNFAKTGFSFGVSDLRDVPDDLIEMCCNYIKNNTASCYFNCEDQDATLVVNPDTAYIIINTDDDELNVLKLEEEPQYIIKNIVDGLLKNIKDVAKFHCRGEEFEDSTALNTNERILELTNKLYWIHDRIRDI